MAITLLGQYVRRKATPAYPGIVTGMGGVSIGRRREYRGLDHVSMNE